MIKKNFNVRCPFATFSLRKLPYTLSFYWTIYVCVYIEHLYKFSEVEWYGDVCVYHDYGSFTSLFILKVFYSIYSC